MNRRFQIILLLLILSGFSFVYSNPVAGWSDVFYRPGFNNAVEALTPWQDGFLVGGYFETAGPIAARGVAYHDGSQWHALGEGLDSGRVAGFAEFEGDLYAYGRFRIGGSMPIVSLARWDGVEWHSVGVDLDDSVEAVAGFDGHLYCAAQGIYRLDGLTWTRVIETNAWVHQLLEFDGQLVAGGDFTMANGTEAAYMLGWDGYVVHASFQGLESRPEDLVIHENQLHAVGWISDMGEPARGWVQSWSGSQWELLGSGLLENHASIRMASTDGDLFILGMRWTGGPTEDFVLRWTGSIWEDYFVDQDAQYFRDLVIQDGKFWLGGRFDDLRGSGSTNLAWHDGDDWHAPFPGGRGCDGPVLSMAVHEDRLLIGGGFRMAGDNDSPIVADWTGSEWSEMPDWQDLEGNPVKPPLESRTQAVASLDDQLLATGNWGEYSGFIAQRTDDEEPWNLTSTESYRSILVWGDHVYASTNEHPDPERVIRRPLAGGDWETLGVTGGIGAIEAIAIWNGHIVAGGFFLSMGGEPADGLAIYDGESWSELGGGTMGSVYALTVWRGDLVVGGNFSVIGEHYIDNLAVFDGQNWHSLGGIQSGHAHALGHYGSSLAVGGCFLRIGNLEARCIALWDGEEWSTLEGGVEGMVSCIAQFQGSLYVGGYIWTAGGSPSSGLACWTDPTITGLEDDLTVLPSANMLDPAHPNPFNPSTNLLFRLDHAGLVNLSVMDVRGRHLRTLIATALPAGDHQARWDGRADDGRSMSSGVYLVKLQAGSVESVRKITLAR